VFPHHFYTEMSNPYDFIARFSRAKMDAMNDFDVEDLRRHFSVEVHRLTRIDGGTEFYVVNGVTLSATQARELLDQKVTLKQLKDRNQGKDLSAIVTGA
jgi:hypothetical protein